MAKPEKQPKTISSSKITKENKYCLTPKFRVSFPHVFEPHSGFEGQEAKFSLTMLFDSKTDLSELKRAAKNAAIEKWGPKEKWPKGLRLPFRDGNEKSDLDGYEDTVFVTASSKQRPGVVDQKKAPILPDDGTFYAGCYARASLIAFAYDTLGNRGVSFGLQNLQKLEDGEPFSGRKNASEEFDAVEDNSEDEDSYETEDDNDDDDL